MFALSRGRRRAAEWTIALVVLLAVSVSASARQRSIGIGKTVASALADLTGKPMDDIDDFVPFQGERHDEFDWSLFQSLAKKNSGNLLVSPISLKLALVLLYEGAQDKSAQELATAMNLTSDKPKTRVRFATILKSMQEKSPDYSLNFGSRFYLDNSISLRQRYQAMAAMFYDAQVLNANFSDTRATADEINAFVNNVTEGHIPELIGDAEGLKDSLMVIVNTLYFKGSWYQQPFEVRNTKTEAFLAAGGHSVQVPYMVSNRKFYLGYIKDLDARILRLPYAGHKFSMFIVLPQQPRNLSELVSKLSPSKMSEFEWLMTETSVEVKLPRFKFDFTSHLENNLRELGINEIFDETATLTGILRSKSTSRQLVVTDIVQKSGIEVNEQGSTVHTATEVEIGTKMSDETFHASHPFMFYIEDESAGTILYMGVVNNPLEQNGMAKAAAEPTPPAPAPMEKPVVLAAAIPTAPRIGQVERSNYFNIELLQRVNEAEPGNVVVGTSTIKAALTILAEAAAGQTQQQILSSLRIADFSSETRKASNPTAGSYKDPTGNTELQTAIKLWLGKNVAVRKNYSDAVQRYYGGEIEVVDFSKIAATARAINKWITNYTHGRITSLADPSSLTESTKLLLTTSAYFKGKWQNNFNKADTRKRCFNVPNVGCRDVMMMEIVADYKYAYVTALESEAVLIPYTGGRMGMLMILPRENQTLAELSRDIAFTPVSAILSVLQETQLLLQIPRFSMGNKFNVQDKLSKMNIKDLFGDNADLSAAFPDNGVKIGAFLHNAQIEVNEEGTVAAAVSEAQVMPLMGSSMTTFRADRPFLFFLLDLERGEILFAGRYVQPEEPKLIN